MSVDLVDLLRWRDLAWAVHQRTSLDASAWGPAQALCDELNAACSATVTFRPVPGGWLIGSGAPRHYTVDLAGHGLAYAAIDAALHADRPPPSIARRQAACNALAVTRGWIDRNVSALSIVVQNVRVWRGRVVYTSGSSHPMVQTRECLLHVSSR